MLTNFLTELAKDLRCKWLERLCGFSSGQAACCSF